MAETDENGLKKTPMYEYYLENNIKISDFHGWALPIQFTKLAEEHEAVRDRVGIFDVAHMGEIQITGEHAVEFVNSLITNDATNTKDNQAMYTAITNEEGGTLDDVIFYKHSDEHIIFTPNASNTDKIFDWFTKHNQDNKVKIENASDEMGIIALQGPKAEATLQKLTQADLSEIKPFQFIPEAIVADVQPVVISRTGYTGEDGFELYVPFNQQPEIWKQLLKAGEEFGMKECGLGARDTLRLEAGLALYGNELTEEINPFEGGIGFAVKLGDKKAVDYPGKKALLDYGVHAPTTYFPLIIEEALMIEPTETESKADLDLTADTFIQIAKEVDETLEKVSGAPHLTSVRRLDEATASRRPVLTHDPKAAQAQREFAKSRKK